MNRKISKELVESLGVAIYRATWAFGKEGMCYGELTISITANARGYNINLAVIPDPQEGTYLMVSWKETKPEDLWDSFDDTTVRVTGFESVVEALHFSQFVDYEELIKIVK